MRPHPTRRMGVEGRRARTKRPRGERARSLCFERSASTRVSRQPGPVLSKAGPQVDTIPRLADGLGKATGACAVKWATKVVTRPQDTPPELKAALDACARDDYRAMDHWRRCPPDAKRRDGCFGESRRRRVL